MSHVFDRALRSTLLGVALLAAAVHAQTGTVAGTVTTEGRPLAGANVVLDGTNLGAVSATDGRFEIARVPAGTYTVRASSVGFAPATQRVTVGDGATVRVRLALAPAAGRLGEVVVEGRAANLVGQAGAASEGRVGQAEIAPRPLLRVGEVMETVPGLIATQHSGNGKANQFFLRGFNLDHGTDFSASVEGVPLNLRTHAHGQGYLDLGFLIPELIETIAFDKGPYDAAGGDFSTAGSARIRFVRRLDRGIARAEVGTDRHYDALVANSSVVGGGSLLAAGRVRYYDGPWVEPENSALFTGLLKFSRGTDADGYSLTALGYHNDWDATDQIARRAVESGQIDRLGTLDPTNGGTTGRYTLAGQWQRTQRGTVRTQASAYAAYYHLNLFSNFTYFLDDPTQGDQFEQADRRVYAGASVAQDWFSPAFREGATTTLGADLRHDQILGVGLFRTADRVRVSTVRDDDVAETSAGLYVRNETRWTPWFRSVAGLRGDVYRFDVESDTGVNSGTETDFIASPKLSLAVGPFARTEGYLNLGLGYHSNDARGTTIQVDPQTGDPVDPVDPLVRTRGAEVGVRTAALAGLQSTVSLWVLGLDSELVFVGDAGGTEASDASRHVGVEFTNAYRAMDWLNLTLDVALTRSRFLDVAPDADRIENSIGQIVTGGIYAAPARGVLGSLQLRYFGPRPLTGDGSVEAEATLLLNGRVGYRLGRVEVALDVLNLLDAEDTDVSYFYASRLDGEPADGVEDVHFHPVIPRTARLALTLRL